MLAVDIAFFQGVFTLEGVGGRVIEQFDAQVPAGGFVAEIGIAFGNLRTVLQLHLQVDRIPGFQGFVFFRQLHGNEVRGIRVRDIRAGRGGGAARGQGREGSKQQGQAEE